MKDTQLSKQQSHRCNKFPCDSVPRYKVPELHSDGRNLTYKEAYEAIEMVCRVTYRDEPDGTKTRVLNKIAFDRLCKLNDNYKRVAHDYLVAFAENMNRELAEVNRIASEMKAKDEAGDTSPLVVAAVQPMEVK